MPLIFNGMEVIKRINSHAVTNWAKPRTTHRSTDFALAIHIIKCDTKLINQPDCKLMIESCLIQAVKFPWSDKKELRQQSKQSLLSLVISLQIPQPRFRSLTEFPAS